MSEVNAIVDQLRQLSKHYIGIQEQRECYIEIVQRLRILCSNNQSLFTETAISEINDLKKEIETKEGSQEKPLINKEKPASLRNGSVVFHKWKYFVGIIDDTTSAKELFEDPHNEKEYRVRVTKTEIRIASPKNLVIVGSAYNKRCWNCKGYVGYSLKRCKHCGWYICLICGACGCGYKGTIEKG